MISFSRRSFNDSRFYDEQAVKKILTSYFLPKLSSPNYDIQCIDKINNSELSNVRIDHDVSGVLAQVSIHFDHKTFYYYWQRIRGVSAIRQLKITRSSRHQNHPELFITAFTVNNKNFTLRNFKNLS